jgi:NAD(P)-dependent dehydrogenase (short-subunit alcohol dehydrogenase family)
MAQKIGATASFKRTDTSNQDQIRELIEHAVAKFGGLHVMVNNAGVSGKRHANLLEEDFADFQRVLGVNLLGVMAGTRDAARHMSQNGGGSIINITSIGGMNPGPSLWAYNASKAAVIHFTKSSAIEIGGYGVRANCIAPGNIETPIMAQTMAGHLPPEEKAAVMKNIRSFLISRQPLQLQGVPEDTAQAALFFASDRSRYITATVLPVDGGLVAGSPSTAGGFRDSLKPAG